MIVVALYIIPLRDQLLKKGSGKKLLLAGVSIFIIAMTLASLLLPYSIGTNVYAQNASKSSDIPGNVVNSKYLTITGHRYRQRRIYRYNNWNHCK
jgi:hypothetical protein